jgi:NADH:ubiquinone oxidoreductase subunit K
VSGLFWLITFAHAGVVNPGQHPITLGHFLCLGSTLFGIGLYGVLTRRNAVGMLLSLELMFNAANINLIATNRFLGLALEPAGQVFAAFIIAVAAAEATVGVAIVLCIYRNFKDINVNDIHLLKW